MYEEVGMVQGKVKERTIVSEYYCGRCGYPVSDHDSYCSECGGFLHMGGSSKMGPEEEHEDWIEKAKHVDRETLPAFVNEMMKNGDGYSDLIYAVSACCIATMNACSNGMTGYQASWVPLIFLQNVNGTGTKTGFKILNYDNMLYPQYEDYFKAYVPEDVWPILQKEAKRRLKDYAENCNELVSENVLKHWIKITSGQPPYGLEIR